MSTVKKIPFFVYGTLLPGQPNYATWQGGVLTAEPATFTPGLLYDLGPYPILIESPAGTVHGQLITISPPNYSHILTHLDKLEDYDPQKPDNGLYRRLVRSVYTADNKTIEAWVYLGSAEWVRQRPLPLILHGSWIKHSQQKEKTIHQWWKNHDPEKGLPHNIPSAQKDN